MNGRTLTVAWVLVAACATATPSGTESASSTTVEASPPEAKPTPEEAFTRIVHRHVERRRSAVEQCYLSEVLSGSTPELADFDLTIRARPGMRQPIVRVVKASRPGQQLLATCVTNALSSVPFERDQFEVFVVPVKIFAPEWLAAK